MKPWIYTLLLVSNALTSSAFAQSELKHLQTITSPHSAQVRTGAAVAMKDRYLVVGRPFATVNGLTKAGEIAIFEIAEDYENYELIKTIRSPFPQQDEQFGSAVDMTTWGRIVVGAPGANQAAGKAYLTAVHGPSTAYEIPVYATPTAGDRLGSSVAIDRELVVIGAPFDRVYGVPSGAIHVYFDVEHAEPAVFVIPANGQAGERFGFSVDADKPYNGDARILVGAPNRTSDQGVRMGAAYEFVRPQSLWIQEELFEPSFGEAGDKFGEAVSFAGQHRVFGAPRARYNGVRQGLVFTAQEIWWPWLGTYIWVQSFLHDPNGTNGARFGAALDATDRALIAGSPFHSSGGKADFFLLGSTGWRHEAEVEYSQTDSGDQAGRSVAVNGALLALGAPRFAYTFTETGAVHLFESRVGTTSGSGVPNSQGLRAEISAAGSAKTQSNYLELRTDGIPDGRHGVYWMSDSVGYQTQYFGQGTLLLGPPIWWVTGVAQSSEGRLSADLDLNLPSLSFPILAGQTWYFQCLYTDTPSYNLSNRLTIQFE